MKELVTKLSRQIHVNKRKVKTDFLCRWRQILKLEGENFEFRTKRDRTKRPLTLAREN